MGYFFSVLISHHRDKWGWVWSAIAFLIGSAPKAVSAMIEGYQFSTANVLILGTVLAVAIAFIRNSYTLERRLRRKLTIRFDPHAGDEFTGGIGYSGPGIRTYRIAIWNDSDELMQQCEVEMAAVTTLDWKPIIQHHFPKNIEYQTQPQGPGRIVAQAPQDINPGTPIYANVVSLDERDQSSEIQLRCASGLGALFVPRSGSYRLQIRTHSPSGVGDSKWFDVYVDTTGKLVFQETTP